MTAHEAMLGQTKFNFLPSCMVELSHDTMNRTKNDWDLLILKTLGRRQVDTKWPKDTVKH